MEVRVGLQAFGAPGTANNIAPFFIDPDFRNPRAAQFQFGLEREIVRSISANVTYAQINTTRVARQRDVNLRPFWVDPTGRRRYNNPATPTSAATVRPLAPKFGKVQVTEAAGRSLYRGITSALNMRRPNYTVDLYYTRSWNYSYDDIERGFTGIAYSDVNDIASEYNYSNIDEPHVFISNVNYSLPLGIDVASADRRRRDVQAEQLPADTNGRLISVPVPATFMQYKDASGHYVTTNGNVAGDPRMLQLGLRFNF